MEICSRQTGVKWEYFLLFQIILYKNQSIVILYGSVREVLILIILLSAFFPPYCHNWKDNLSQCLQF